MSVSSTATGGLAQGPSRGLARLKARTLSYAALCGIGLLLATAGPLPLLQVGVVTAYCLTGSLFFFLLQAGGYSAGFRDPGCVFAGHLFGISVLLFACAMIPQDRAAALQLFLLHWAFDMLGLSRRQQTIAALMTMLGLATILLWSWRASGDGMALRRELTALLMTVFYLPALVAIGHAVRQMRTVQTERSEALAHALAQLQGLSERDALTGASNRRHAQNVMEREAARQARTQRPFSLCLIDLDLFKRINDTHGHATGDAVLVGTAELLRATLPEPFTVARWGGEEFLVLMPETPCALAAGWIERARSGLASRPWPDGLAGLQVDFSAGVCEHRVEDAIAATLERADQGLYLAKERGRGRVVEQRD